MLEYLHLKNVGPAAEMEMSLTERLNIITGDNGLGKSFLLDVAWWALTVTWAGEVILPALPPAIGTIEFRYRKGDVSLKRSSTFNRQFEQWTPSGRGRQGSALVMYAQVSGGFAVCDPARNTIEAPPTPFSSSSSSSISLRPVSYFFSSSEVLDGNEHCEGLIRDWASWQREGNESFRQLRQVLQVLSPSPAELLEPGELRKVSLDDPKRYPTLKMPYGQEVPVIHASAGMRRIIAFAYLLVWAWQEHLAASELRGEPPADRIIFLVDEIESHLHPQWQRRILPAILNVMTEMTGESGVNVQLITTTHSPLVLASAESLFDAARDSWFDLDMAEPDRVVTLQKKPYVRRGDYSNWLTSEAFDLKEARSLEAEEAISAALAVLKVATPNPEEYGGPICQDSFWRSLSYISVSTC